MTDQPEPIRVPITPTRRPTCATCGQRAGAEEVIGEMLRELSHLVRLLETLEWAIVNESTDDRCPTCEGARWQGHVDGCELAARLNGARSAIERATDE